MPSGVTACAGARVAVPATAAALAKRAIATVSPSAGYFLKHVFADRDSTNDCLKCPGRQNGGRSGRVRFIPTPRFLSSECKGPRRGTSVTWDDGIIRAVALAAL